MRLLITVTLITALGCGAAEPVERIAPTPSPSPKLSDLTLTFESSRRHTPGIRAATPTPIPPPKVDRAGSSHGIESYIREVFGRHGDQAVKVARCESNLNPKARGRLGEASIFQMRPEFHAWRAKAVGGSSLWDWRTNVKAAFHLFREAGWRPWTCRRAL